jgi:S-adenosylmethionine:tRNA-ribosyltransferase-isomerase (queuine synthetase)
VNKTQVIPARLYGEMDIFPNGKQEIKNVEILLHKEISANTRECLGYPGKNLKVGRVIRFFDAEKNLILTGKILKVSEMGRFIDFSASGYELLKILHTL